MGPVPRVRCATLGYGVEHLRRSGIQDWGQPPEDDCDSLLRALRVLRGSFPVSPQLPGVASFWWKTLTGTSPRDRAILRCVYQSFHCQGFTRNEHVHDTGLRTSGNRQALAVGCALIKHVLQPVHSLDSRTFTMLTPAMHLTDRVRSKKLKEVFDWGWRSFEVIRMAWSRPR